MAFKALRITETHPGRFEREIKEMDLADLPPGELLIRVQYSSLNYKDAMSATGNKGITRHYPHTPGIDAVGKVELSRNETFAVNDEVIVTGHDLGMNTCGGYAEFIRVPAAWAIKKPLEISPFQAMALGTAGITAAVALHKMETMGQHAAMGPLVVTGATGGVGSIAVALFAKAGYEVIAVTGKSQAREYLLHIGASRVESREFVDDVTGKKLLQPKWAGALDTVGGNTLHTLLRGCVRDGNVVTTGLVGSPALNTTVYPFLLNGVNLLGVGSADTSAAVKRLLWEKLTSNWNITDKLDMIAKEITLEELNRTYFDSILEGKMMGRAVVRI